MASHQVLVQPSARQFPADSELSVLASALAAGITLPHGCRDGACGTCKGRVLSGRLEQGPHAQTALSAAEEAEGMALFCCAYPRSDLVIGVRVADALDGIVARKMPARVEGIGRPAGDVAIVTVKLPAGERLLFRAGQYVDFLLGAGERRSYSIATAQDDPGPLQFHVRHMPGGLFTDTLFAHAAPAVGVRSILRIEGPLGTFHLREDSSRPIVLLASGTGFAPLKSIAETLFAKGLNRDDPVTGRRAREVVLYWGGRTRADLYMDALPRRWQQEQPHFSYVPVLSGSAAQEADAAAHVSADGAPAGADAWIGRTGLVHHAVMQDLPDLSACEVYACGAPVMVEAARRDFIGRCGLPAEHFHSDAFVTRADRARDAQ